MIDEEGAAGGRGVAIKAVVLLTATQAKDRRTAGNDGWDSRDDTLMLVAVVADGGIHTRCSSSNDDGEVDVYDPFLLALL